MTTNPRETQFAGFAESLFDDLLDIRGVYIDTMRDDWREEWKQTIAQRAYDLATHIYGHTLGAITRDPELGLRNVPDLTQWSEESR